MTDECVYVLAFWPCGGRAWPPAVKTPCCASVAIEPVSKARTVKLSRQRIKAKDFGVDGSMEGSSAADRLVRVGAGAGRSIARWWRGVDAVVQRLALSHSIEQAHSSGASTIAVLLMTHLVRTWRQVFVWCR